MNCIDWIDKAGCHADQLFPSPATDVEGSYPLAALRESKRGAFQYGAVWQRSQLRTDEAVEKLANFLFEDDNGESIDQHEKICHDASKCRFRNDYTQFARAAITALLGEKP